MKKNASLCLVLLLFICFLWSCDRSDNSEYVRKINVDDEILEYTYFPEGSYWIFKNVVSGEIDSSFVSIQGERYSRYEKEWIDDKYLNFESLSIRKFIRGREFSCMTFIEHYEATTPLKLTTYRIYNNELGSDYPFSWDSTKSLAQSNNHVEFHDSIWVGARWYYNVLESNLTPEIEDSVYFVRTFYAKGIGAIRREFSDGSSWDLVKYHIEK